MAGYFALVTKKTTSSGIICIKSTRHKNPKDLKIAFQYHTSACPCVNSKWLHYSTPIVILKNNTTSKAYEIHTPYYL
jgi:hypothetical protein